jgi:tetratricopeptide (TPR) repeat protein
MEQTARRHASYFLELAEEAELHLVGDDQAEWLDRMSMEHDNVRAALRWTIDAGEAETGLRVAGAIWRFWQYRGYLTEGRQWLRDLLAPPAAAAHPAARAKALSAAGGLAYWQSDFVDTRRCYEEAVALARDLGDRRILFQALFNMAHVPGLEGDMETAWAKFKEALAIARELDDSRGIVDVTGALGYVALARGDHESALAFAAEAIALARETGYRFQVAESLETVGQVNRMLGKYEESRAALLESLLLRKKGGNLPGLVTSLLSMAALASAEGHHERAARLWGAASVLHDESEGVAPLGLAGAGYAAPAQRMLGYVIDDARQELGDQTVRLLLKEGRAMTLEEAVAYAGEED